MWGAKNSIMQSEGVILHNEKIGHMMCLIVNLSMIQYHWRLLDRTIMTAVKGVKRLEAQGKGTRIGKVRYLQ